MQHVDDDQLTLLALGADEADATTAAHLESCARCRRELEELRRVVTAGALAPTPAELVRPPDRVWEGITSALAADEARSDDVDAPRATVTGMDRPRQRRVPTWLAVAAGFVIGALGAGTLVAVLDDDPASSNGQEVASAALDPLGDTGTAGSAEVLDVDGHRVLAVSIDDRTPGGGYREVWLLDTEAQRLVSLGVLEGTETRFAIPDGLDLAEFPVVDVSREPLDGDPAHSSDSIARGQLAL